MDERRRAIVFYDGDCGLCSRSVHFLMNADKTALLHFAPLQGNTATELLSCDLRKSLDTLVYRRSNGQILLRSDAVLHTLIDTRSNWRFIAQIALILPASLRNVLYDGIAKRRQRFFPKGSCPLPSPEESKQLLP